MIPHTHTQKQLEQKFNGMHILEELKTSPAFKPKQSFPTKKYYIFDAKQHNNFLLLDIVCEYWHKKCNRIIVLINIDEDFSDNNPPSQFSIKRYEEENISIYIPEKFRDSCTYVKYYRSLESETTKLQNHKNKTFVNYKSSHGKVLQIYRKNTNPDEYETSEVLKHIFILKNKIVDFNPENFKTPKNKVLIYNLHNPSEKKIINCEIPEHIYFPGKPNNTKKSIHSRIKKTSIKTISNCTDNKIIFSGLSSDFTDKQKNKLYVFDTEEAYSNINKEACFYKIDFNLEIEEERDLDYTKKNIKYTEYENMLLHEPKINITKISNNTYTLNIKSNLYKKNENSKYKNVFARKNFKIIDPGPKEQFKIAKSFYQYTPEDHCHNIHTIPVKTQDNYQLIACFPVYYDDGHIEKILKCEIFNYEGNKVKKIDCAELKKYIKELESFKINMPLQFFSFDKTIICCQIGYEIMALYDLENEKITKKFISDGYFSRISPKIVSRDRLTGLSNEFLRKKTKSIAKEPSSLEDENTTPSKIVRAHEKLFDFTQKYHNPKIDVEQQQTTSEHLNVSTNPTENFQKKPDSVVHKKRKKRKIKKSRKQISFKKIRSIHVAINHILSKNILLTTKNVTDFYQTFHFTGLQQLANAIMKKMLLKDRSLDNNSNKHFVNNFLILMYYQIKTESLNLTGLQEHIRSSFKKKQVFFFKLMFCDAFEDPRSRTLCNKTKLRYSSSNQTEKFFLKVFKEKEELFEKLFLCNDTNVRKGGSNYTRLSLFLKAILNPSCCIFLSNLLRKNDWDDLLCKIIDSIDCNALSSTEFLKITNPKDLKMLLFNTNSDEYKLFLYLFLEYPSNAKLLSKLIAIDPFRKTVLSFKKNLKSKFSRKKNKTGHTTTNEPEFYKIWLQLFEDDFDGEYFLTFYQLCSITGLHPILKNLFNNRKFARKIEESLLKFAGDNIDKTTWLLKLSEKLSKDEISLLNPQNIFLPLLFEYKRSFKKLFPNENSTTICINHLALHSFGDFLLLLLSPKMKETSDIINCLTSKEHAENWLNAFFSTGKRDNLTLTSIIYDSQNLLEDWNLLTKESCFFNCCYSVVIRGELFLGNGSSAKILSLQRFFFILKNKFFAKVFSELNRKFFNKASLGDPFFLLNDECLDNENYEDNDSLSSNDNNIENEDDEDNDNSSNTYNNTKKALFSLLSEEKGNEIFFRFLEKTHKYLHKSKERNKKKNKMHFAEQIIKKLLLKYSNEWFLKYLEQTQKRTKPDHKLLDDFNDDDSDDYRDKDHPDDFSSKVVFRGDYYEFKSIKNSLEYFKIFNLYKENVEKKSPSIQTQKIAKKLNLSWLKILDLSNSNIKRFDVNNTFNFSNLEILNLSNNKMLHLRIDGNNAFCRLKMLFASKNLLTNVEINGCGELLVIDLSYNQLGLKPGSLHISNSCTKVKSLLLDSNEYNNNLDTLPILPEKCKAKVILRKHLFSNLTKCLIRKKYNDVILDNNDLKELTIMSMQAYTDPKYSEHTTIYKDDDRFHIEEERITKEGIFEKIIIQKIANRRFEIFCDLRDVLSPNSTEKLTVLMNHTEKKFTNISNDGYTLDITHPLKPIKEITYSTIKRARNISQIFTSRHLNCKIEPFCTKISKEKLLTKPNLKILLEQHIDKLLDSEIKRLKIDVFALIKTMFISESFSEETIKNNKIMNSINFRVIRENSAKFFEEENFILFVVKNILQANLLDCLKKFKKMESLEKSDESEESEEKKNLTNLLYKKAANLSPKEIFSLIEDAIADKTERIHEKIDVLIYKKISVIVKDTDETLHKLNEDIETNLKQISIELEHKSKEEKIKASLNMFELSKQRCTKMYEKNTFLKVMLDRTLKNKEADYRKKKAKKFFNI